MTRPKAEFVLAAEDRTAQAFRSAEQRIDAIAPTARRAALGVAALTTAFVAGTTKAVQHADSIAKNARAVGFSTDAYQELQFTMSQFGVSAEKTDASLERFTKRIGEAVNGTGAARKEYERLGIELTDANGRIRDSEEVLDDVALALQGMETEAQRSATAAALFGREGVRMKDALAGGPETLDEYARTARELGLVLDTSLLRNAELASDQLDRMQRITSAQLTVAFSAFFPMVLRVGNAFAEAAPRVREFFDALNPDSDLNLFGSLGELDQKIAETEKRLADLTSGRGAAASEESRRAAGPGGFLGTTVAGLKQSIDSGELEAEVERLYEERERIQEEIRKRYEARRIDAEGLDSGANAGDGVDIPGIGSPEAHLEAAEQMFDRLFEIRLAADEQEEELEQFRRERELERIEARRQQLIDDETINAVLEEEFRVARENAVEASERRIQTIRANSARSQIQLQQRVTQQELQLRRAVATNATALIDQLAGESKGAAIAVLAIQKSLAIADVIIQSKRAAMRALADLGPVLGPPVAAKFTALGYTNAALIAAQGLAQAAGAGGGGGGFGGSGGSGAVGLPADDRATRLPFPGENVQEQDTNQAATEVRLVFGDTDTIGRALMDSLRVEISEGDAVLIEPDSRQAQEIRAGV